MKIVVLDGYTENPGDLSWAGLEALGEVAVYDRTSYVDDPIIAERIERIGDAEVVITNKTPITKATIDKCPNMKLIAFLATGYNAADYNYAKEKGVLVANVPTYGTASVGQYAIALLLEICHHIGHHSETVHAGKWQNHIDWWASGRTTSTGAIGTTPSSSWTARPPASSASAASARPPERLPRLWA